MNNSDTIKQNINKYYKNTKTKSLDLVNHQSEYLKTASSKTINNLKERLQKEAYAVKTLTTCSVEDAKQQINRCILLAKDKSNQVIKESKKLSQNIGKVNYIADKAFLYASEHNQFYHLLNDAKSENDSLTNHNVLNKAIHKVKRYNQDVKVHTPQVLPKFNLRNELLLDQNWTIKQSLLERPKLEQTKPLSLNFCSHIKDAVKQKFLVFYENRPNINEITKIFKFNNVIKPVNGLENETSIVNYSFGVDEPVRTITIENKEKSKKGTTNTTNTKKHQRIFNNVIGKVDRILNNKTTTTLHKESNEKELKGYMDDLMKYKENFKTHVKSVVNTSKDSINLTIDSSVKNFNKLVSDVINEINLTEIQCKNNVDKNNEKRSEDLIESATKRIKEAKTFAYDWGVNKLKINLCKLNQKLKDSNGEECVDQKNKTLDETLKETKYLCKDKMQLGIVEVTAFFRNSLTNSYRIKDYVYKTATEMYESAKKMYDNHANQTWTQIVDLAEKVDVRGKIDTIKKQSLKFAYIIKNKVSSFVNPDEEPPKRIDRAPCRPRSKDS